MSVLYIALPIALLLGGSALMACLHCIQDGQFDDLDSPPLRILMEDRRMDAAEKDTCESQPRKKTL